MSSVHLGSGVLEFGEETCKPSERTTMSIGDYDGPTPPEYGPEAEPDWVQSRIAAEAGDYEKSIAYGIMHLGACLETVCLRLGEISSALEGPAQPVAPDDPRRRRDEPH
jgi:hypothetical protein